MKTVAREIAAGRFHFEDGDEDIHLNVERRLIELAGEAGRRVHAGRSRNDQVALDLRLWTLDAIARAGKGLRALGLALLDRAEVSLDARVIVAARTHTRPAQPVLLAHAFHAYVEMLLRDLSRLESDRRAASGEPFALRFRVPRESLEQVRFPDAVYATPVARRHGQQPRRGVRPRLPRGVRGGRGARDGSPLAARGGFDPLDRRRLSPPGSVRGRDDRVLDDASKKNPDSLELARGKTGRVAGHLMGTLMVVKGLPLSYNRDLQETQEALFDTAETLEVSLAGMTEAVAGLKLRPASDRPPLDPSTLATDIAEELVRRGVPFRTAHERVARWSRTATESSKNLRDVAARQERELSSFLRRLTPETSVARRDGPGGTAPRRVRAALKRAANVPVVPEGRA